MKRDFSINVKRYKQFDGSRHIKVIQTLLLSNFYSSTFCYIMYTYKPSVSIGVQIFTLRPDIKRGYHKILTEVKDEPNFRELRLIKPVVLLNQSVITVRMRSV